MTSGELLFGGLALLVALAALFWPDRGLLARMQTSKLQADREKLEDALKHLYDLEARGLPCTPEGIADVLPISATESVYLVRRLVSIGLLKGEGAGHRPTLKART